METQNLILIVCGPTASGKSARALDIAKQRNGVVINCDSMQIYEGLPILTAQPSPHDLQEAPHELYGALKPDEKTSAGHWSRMARSCIENAFLNNRTPIICGGTGLYIKALMEGFSPIPDIPQAIRQRAVEEHKRLGNPGFHVALAKRDPEMAGRFHPLHTARLLRAWEVLEFTGKSLSEWQKEPRIGPPDHWRFEVHKIIPERGDLHARCDARLLTMLENGVLDEIEDFAKRVENGKIQSNAPLTRALGYRPLLAHIKGDILKHEAITQAQAETRQYAKRQITWFRNQI